jgi:kynureninase
MPHRGPTGAAHDPLDPAVLRAADAVDPFAALRAEFIVPAHAGRDGEHGELAYFCGNSLGLQPRGAMAFVAEVMEKWATQAVEGHFEAPAPWIHAHELVREPLARLVGAEPLEVTAMNTLTVNLHLLMASFYRPTAERPLILIEASAFPSDRHAVASQIRWHGLDPADCLVELAADEPKGTLSDAAILEAIAQHGPRLALVLWPGVQYRTGQAFDLAAIAGAARGAGARVGFDLAHAIGNLPLALHDSGADFAVWCHYKYLNAGPGAVAGAFVHARHAQATDLPRLAGWWGHDPATRFRMAPEFVPAPGADGWQVSNPPILSLAPLQASLALFERVGMPALRARSLELTGMLEALVLARLEHVLEILTPREPARRGCQLSLRVRAGRDAGRALFEFLCARGVLGDWREPDVIRISPAPLYNTRGDLLRFVEAVEDWARVGMRSGASA